MEDTIFDKILRKEIDADIVYENEWVCAFRDIAPQAPVHILVIPKKKMKSFHDMLHQDPVFLGHFMQGIAEVADSVQVAQNGYRVVFNSGVDGQQTVDYLHAHILAGRQMTWPPG